MTELNAEESRFLSPTRKRPSRLVPILGLGAALVVMSLALVAIASASSGPDGPSPVELFSVLDREWTPSDTAPATERPIVAESARILYSDGSTTAHWLAVDDKGEICMIVQYEPNSSDWVVGITCSGTSAVAERGLTLRLTALQGGVDATVLPDAMLTPETTRAVTNAGASMPATNLVVFPLGDRPESLVIESGSSSVDLGLGFGDPPTK